MRSDNKLECKEVELNAKDSQNLLSVVLSDLILSKIQTFNYLPSSYLPDLFNYRSTVDPPSSPILSLNFGGAGVAGRDRHPGQFHRLQELLPRHETADDGLSIPADEVAADTQELLGEIHHKPFIG